jgi:hypothetical protein
MIRLWGLHPVVVLFASVLSCARDTDSGAKNQQAFSGIAEVIKIVDGKPKINVLGTMDATLKAMDDAALACSNNGFMGTQLPDGRSCKPYECAMKIASDASVSGIDFRLQSTVSAVGSSATFGNRIEVIYSPSASENRETLQCIDISVSSVFYLKASSAVRKEIMRYESLKPSSSSQVNPFSSSRSNSVEASARCVKATGNYDGCMTSPHWFSPVATQKVSHELKQKLDQYVAAFSSRMKKYCSERFSVGEGQCPANAPCRLERYESFVGSGKVAQMSIFSDFNQNSGTTIGAKICDGGGTFCGTVTTGNGESKVSVTVGTGNSTSLSSRGSKALCVAPENHPLTREFSAFLATMADFID